MSIMSTRMSRLVSIFAAWKCILLAIACASPGPGYDTSTNVLFSSLEPSSKIVEVVQHAVLRLTRWDGIYFANSSARGHLYEQEWAFSWLSARLTSYTASVLFSPFAIPDIVKHALSCILISHLSHLLAVLVLYKVIYAIVPSTPERKSKLAFITATLHILSPAGLFLSAPYAESTFALFNFLGIYTYSLATKQRFSSNGSLATESLLTILCGITLAIAAGMRGNGLLSGIPILWDALLTLPNLPSTLPNPTKLLRLASTVLAGLILAIGFALPQFVAYQHFCANPSPALEPRPWCTAMPPSIYSFVQAHYWNVGFLKYWEVAQIPLFLLAAPMSAVMASTAWAGLSHGAKISQTINEGRVEATEKAKSEAPNAQADEEKAFTHLLPRLALPQLVLVVMALTSFHVQIINRISSGYPLWYFVLAIVVCGVSSKKSGERGLLWTVLNAEWAVRAMVMYAVIQGGLYAAFLPPA